MTRKNRSRDLEPDRITSVRVKSFKSISDSDLVELSPFTVFVGNNGSGKSSLIEGLEFMHDVMTSDLDGALTRWRGIEHVWNKRQKHYLPWRGVNFRSHTNPILIQVSGREEGKVFMQEMRVNASEGMNEIFIQHERELVYGKLHFTRGADGFLRFPKLPSDVASFMGEDREYPPGISVFADNGYHLVRGAGFHNLRPEDMIRTDLKHRAQRQTRLSRDGANLSEYLQDFRDRDPEAFEGVLDTMRFVLPYMVDIQPTQTTEMDRRSCLQLAEGINKHAVWMFSTGSIRILALLALLRDPKRPSVIFIEEIENGLDPRTISLLVDEIRRVVESGRTQVIVTTHSPYFLDLVEHEHVVLVERDETGEPKFIRPDSIKELDTWRKEYSPGRLYTNVLLNRKNV